MVRPDQRCSGICGGLGETHFTTPVSVRCLSDFLTLGRVPKFNRHAFVKDVNTIYRYCSASTFHLLLSSGDASVKKAVLGHDEILTKIRLHSAALSAMAVMKQIVMDLSVAVRAYVEVTHGTQGGPAALSKLLGSFASVNDEAKKIDVSLDSIRNTIGGALEPLSEAFNICKLAAGAWERQLKPWQEKLRNLMVVLSENPADLVNKSESKAILDEQHTLTQMAAKADMMESSSSLLATGESLACVATNWKTLRTVADAASGAGSAKKKKGATHGAILLGATPGLKAAVAALYHITGMAEVDCVQKLQEALVGIAAEGLDIEKVAKVLFNLAKQVFMATFWARPQTADTVRCLYHSRSCGSLIALARDSCFRTRCAPGVPVRR